MYAGSMSALTLLFAHDVDHANAAKRDDSEVAATENARESTDAYRRITYIIDTTFRRVFQKNLISNGVVRRWS